MPCHDVFSPHAASQPTSDGAQCVQAAPSQTASMVWTADALHTGAAPVVATGHAALDDVLPGGGWPAGALIELLPTGGTEEGAAVPLWPLVLPALATVAAPGPVGALGAGPVVLVGAPAPWGQPGPCQPCLPALAAAGLLSSQLVWLRGDSAAAELWSAEQALRCAEVGAVMAWLPQARQADLRRLHLAAAQRGAGLLFVLRSARAAREASPALLRLGLSQSAAAGAGESGALAVHVIKRRGPPLAQPLQLQVQPARLRAQLAAQAMLLAQPGQAPQASHGSARVLPFAARSGVPSVGGQGLGAPRDAVDRFAVAA